LLYLGPDSSQPIRVQGAFVSEDEVKKVVDFIKQQAEDLPLDEEEDLADSLGQQLDNPMAASLGGLFGAEGEVGSGDDELYQQAKEIVIQSKKASTSMLQRRLKVGYARAARIVDMLEEHGVVGPADGPKGREVLLSAESDSQAPNYEDPESDQAKREKWG
jgi:S-DNA-T family DNA segregation ATPase FtsK/SpoIIIE